MLFGVDLDVERGEIVALLGTNGAGKSTLLKAISGLVETAGGTVTFDGEDITNIDPVDAAKRGIVQVPGGKAVFPTLTVAEHFKAGTWLYAKEDQNEVNARIEEVLDEFPRLRERWAQMAGNLSGGEQQQLAVGMAFVAKPRLLIIDELSLGSGTDHRRAIAQARPGHPRAGMHDHPRGAVDQRRVDAGRARLLHGEGRGAFLGTNRRVAQRGDILRSVFLEGTGAKKQPAAPKHATPPLRLRSRRRRCSK